jgi:arylsulfatase
MPAKLKAMQALFAQEAKKFNVYPLDNQAFARAITPRPSAVAGRTDFTYTGVNIGIPTGNAPNVLNRSFKIAADVDVQQGGGNGMIVTEGGRWAGYGLYLLNGRPVFTYNLLGLLVARWANDGDAPLTPGKHNIVFDFAYDGPGVAKGGTGVLSVDGHEVRRLSIPRTIPFLIPPDETFDIGGDTRTGVNDLDYQVPFNFDGKIDKLTIHLGPTNLTRDEQKAINRAVAIARD